MALAKAYAVGLVGLDGHVVEVEADLAQGLPGLAVIGLPDAALAEARDRVRAAVVKSGQTWPKRRVTLALSPAAVPKRGSGLDLAKVAPIPQSDLLELTRQISGLGDNGVFAAATYQVTVVAGDRVIRINGRPRDPEGKGNRSQ